MRRVAVVMIAAALSGGLLVSSAGADMLADDPNAMPAWQGTAYYDTAHIFGVTYFRATVDYAVYAPGNFAKTFGFDPAPGQYVYAYQIIHVSDGLLEAYLTRFSVGLDDNEQAGNIATIAATGEVDVSNASFATLTAGWDFNPQITAGKTGCILYFTSPYDPEWDSASVLGYFGDTQQLPSPAPEPTSLALIAAGFVLVLARRRRHHWNA